MGLGERPRVDLAPRSKEDEEVDEFLIGVGHGRAVDESAVDQFELHVVVADDDDVLDAVVVDQRLEAAEPKERVEDRLRCGLLTRRTPRALTGIGRIGHRRLDEIEDDRPAELLLRGPVEATAIGRDDLT